MDACTNQSVYAVATTNLSNLLPITRYRPACRHSMHSTIHVRCGTSFSPHLPLPHVVTTRYHRLQRHFHSGTERLASVSLVEKPTAPIVRPNLPWSADRLSACATKIETLLGTVYGSFTVCTSEAQVFYSLWRFARRISDHG